MLIYKEMFMGSLKSMEEEAQVDLSRGRETWGEACLACLKEIRVLLEENQRTPVTINEGAEISGFSADHLRRLIREGKLEDVSTNGTIRVRAGDLPRKSFKCVASSNLFLEPWELAILGSDVEEESV